MANLPEQKTWIDGIYQLETSDPVVGGPGGISNRQAEQLASRTTYLKSEQEKTGNDLATHVGAVDPHTQYAPKASPALTGTPTAPTAAQTANSNQIATTAFVKAAITTLINGSPAALDTLQELANALGNDPDFRTTVLNAIADAKADATNKLNAHVSTLDAHTQYAPKASPSFTGTPTAPTAATGSNDTQLATTAFVKVAIAALVNGSPAALDTLQELAYALGNDPNFSTTILNALAGKLAKDQNGADISNKPLFLSNINAVSTDTFQVITGKKLFSADSDTLTIKPAADGQRAYIQFNNAASTEAIAFVGLRYGASEQGLTLEHRSGASIRIDNGEINFYGIPSAATAPAGTKTTQLASTAFVQNELAATTGIPQPWPRATAPTGWLKCNGQLFDTSAFPRLAAAYPTGALPDLRGEFMRGWDDGRGVDSGRALLSAQSDAIRNIVGEIWTSAANQQFLGEALSSSGVFELLYEFAVGAIPDAPGTSCPTSMRFDASRTVPTANENRPRNIAFNYIVRAA
ncbi:putative bacteriophage tail fiber protein [Pectobacterium atrosepticum SCRI1043]|uniref:Bacteriophage tail fiber protein n=1 Tax=Pectobacterium atrosepticum (strain SCRI 1043 / ATCC BAA-672) TaxID=218491 RepID=Q6D0Q7_PECAS|nr:phage tail protein [Pectobacterium atrosepticum]AIA72763.1 tail fiber protein [Pectobacterium atrosepticum]AIK15746.1 putative bacteriophage tail fiber protein [Pectobacterium atrosepticum]MCL6317782.1 phage tail protein [Pectobacterium atrosepticum]MCL6322325.1 phage tail protein [Pectobacterium atrosepticum]POW25384.1 phage tail protein [Pectobacterium atrosepticum]